MVGARVLWARVPRPLRYLPLALGLGGLVFAVERSFSAAGVAPALVTSANRPQGLRIFAEPRDVLLQNAHVSAVIRRRDGALVDFSRRRATLPTTDQLGATTDIDGLWELLPLVVLPKGTSWTLSEVDVRAESGAVSVSGRLTVDPLVLMVRLRYVLFHDRPVVRVEATFSAHETLPPQLETGVLVRWGNSAYFVEGNAQPLLSFVGPVSWAGRRGAGGDLMLRAIEPSRFEARFQSRPGFQAPLHAFAPHAAAADRVVRATFELGYQPLPLTPASEPAIARLEVDVRDERGRPLAAKATLLPADDAHRAVFPMDGGLAGADRFAWTGNGAIATEPPPGRYTVLVSAGPERDMVRREVSLAPGRTQRLKATLPRVVRTEGWLSADLHLHQAPSVDADVSLEARVIAVAAEGLELAVATDHYVVTDLYPTVRDLVAEGVLARPLLTVPGCEVSTLWTRFGHFNVFPLPPNANVTYRDTTPAGLFASARRHSPRGILQVNHPRFEPRLGYFTRYELDPATMQPQKPGFDPSFDALEVYNGDDASDPARVERVLHDFMRLLGSGRRYVATGSSDSHKLAFLDPGVPRTFIAHGAETDDDADATVPIEAAIQALKAGRAIVTSGPFVDASVALAGPGQTAYAVGARSELHVRVLAPPWISANRLRVFMGPEGRVVHDVAIPARLGPVRFDGVLPLEHASATFVIVAVSGDVPLPNSGRDDIRPFAFTNPIWLAP